MIFQLKVIGKDENDVVTDIVSQVGEINTLSLFRQGDEVHRINKATVGLNRKMSCGIMKLFIDLCIARLIPKYKN
jgi:hypothetical protein